MSESVARKELELRLKVTADPRPGNQAMQQLAAQAQKVEQAASKASKALSGVYAGGASSPGSPGVSGAPTMGPAGNASMSAALLQAMQQLNRTMGASLKFDQDQLAKQQQDSAAKADVTARTKRLTDAKRPGIFGQIAESGLLGSGVQNASVAGSSSLAGIARVAGAAGLAYGAARLATETGNIANDPYMTTEQKNRAHVRSLPLGGTAQGLIDSVTARDARYQKEDERYRQASAVGQARIEEMGFQGSQNIRQAGLESRARDLASPLHGYLSEGANISDSTIAAGGRRFEQAQRLLAVDRDDVKAQRESAAATAARVAAEREQVKLTQAEKHAREELAKLAEEEKKKGSGPERQNVLNRIAEAREDLHGIGGLQKSAAQAAADAKNAEAQARGAAGMVGARRLNTQAGILEGQAAAAGAGAAGLGGMDPFQRADALNNLRQLQLHGPDALAPEQIASAQGIAPETTRKILEKRGARTDEFRQLQQFAPDDYAGDPAELRRRAAEKRDQAGQAGEDIAKDVAVAARDAGAHVGRVIVDAMRLIQEQIVATIHNDLLRAKGAKE